MWNSNQMNAMLNIGEQHELYVSRISKTMYYGALSSTDNLSLPLIELASELYSESQRGKSLERLHLNNAAQISHNACISPCSLVLALLYLEKLKTQRSDCLDSMCPSDLFVVSLMVSCKYLYDNGENDEVFLDEWSTSTGIPVKQLVSLEKRFLSAIKWELYVHNGAFWQKLHEIEANLAQRVGATRGFFTYTELEKLLQGIDIVRLARCLTTVCVILAASYAMCLVALIGSVAIVNQVPPTVQQLCHFGGGISSATPLIEPLENATFSTAATATTTAINSSQCYIVDSHQVVMLNNDFFPAVHHYNEGTKRTVEVNDLEAVVHFDKSSRTRRRDEKMWECIHVSQQYLNEVNS